MKTRFECEVVFQHALYCRDHRFSLELLQILKRLGLVAGPETTQSVTEILQ
jgi:hypothetical protein